MSKMIELRNIEDRKKYIRDLWINLFNDAPINIDERPIDTGKLNYVYQIKSNNRIIYLKQALDIPKKMEQLGKEWRNYPKERIKYESKYIETLNKYLPTEIELPKILKYDKENNILILSDIQKMEFR